MIKVVRGWSEKKQNFNCQHCRKPRNGEIIQYQNKISIGKLAIMGRGERGFGYLCEECDSVTNLGPKLEKQAAKYKYYDTKRNKKDGNDLTVKSGSKRRKYPVLKTERRERIVKQNRKEGYLSIGLGLVLAILILPFSTTGGAIAASLFTIGGLYAAFEDPERKHRDLIRADKKI